MKIFTRTFLYTLSLLCLIALLASLLIYALMPGVYTERKQRELTTQTDALVSGLEGAKRGDIVGLMARYADILQANLQIQLGSDSYSMSTWNGGVITAVNETGPTPDSGGAPVESKTDDNTSVTKVIVGNYAVIQEGATGSAAAYQDGVAVEGTVSVDNPGNVLNPKTIESKRSFTMENQTGTLTATVTLAPVDEAVGVIVSLLPVTLLFCVVAAVVFSLLYARAITRPIKAISLVTRRMTALDRSAACDVTSKDEFGELADNVNGLYQNLLHTIESLEGELKKVGAAERAKADLLRAASHELKTPVTAAGVIMDNMLLGVGKYKNHAEWLPKCKALIDRLSDMLREILDASRYEAVTEAHTTAAIDSISKEVLEPYLIIARARGLSIYIDWSASFTVTAPVKLLGKALSNIFSNAVQYAAHGGRLAVYCRERCLIVENECAPVPEDRLQRLFEPFYRSEESRSRDTGGNGLGLYITDTILRLIGLEYDFRPMESPPGMRFTITF